MSKTNLRADVSNLFKEIEKREKNIKENEKNKNKNNESQEYKKINKLIMEFIEKKNKYKEKNYLINDIIESLKILNEAYDNMSKNNGFNNFLFQKENMINNNLMKSNNLKKKLHSMDEFNDESDDEILMDDFEIIANPALNEIIDQCEDIQKLLNDNKIKEEHNKINELVNNISKILIEANMLKDNKKLIDDELIKRLNDQINAS